MVSYLFNVSIHVLCVFKPCSYSPYSPPQDQSKNGLITPYAEVRQLDIHRPTALVHGQPPLPNNHPVRGHTARSSRSFSQDDAMNYDFLNSSPQDEYDNLDPSFSSHSGLTHTPGSTHHMSNGGGSYIQVSSGHRVRNKPVSTRLSKSPSASPHHNSPVIGKSSPRKSFPDKLPPSREDLLKLGEGEDLDAYVYMAPLTAFPDAGHDVTVAGQHGRTRVDVELETESGSDDR